MILLIQEFWKLKIHNYRRYPRIPRKFRGPWSTVWKLP